nr:ATP-binding protein [Thermoflexibacter sp.]
NADIVRKMQAETTYLDEIIKDLSSVLAFQKGESVIHEIVNLGEQIHIILKKLEIEIQDSQAFIDIDLREEIFIKTIPSYVQNIFYHLLSNAIKFRHESRKLIIEVKISASNEHELLITIKDNGLGIDMKYAREKIFGLYQRFHPTINGKGIGLYLVKNQVAYLNGRIEVKSEENIGTTFLIYLQKMS